MLTATENQVNVAPRALEIAFIDIHKVMTEELEQRLIDLQERASGLQWDAGDFINDLYDQVMAHNLPVTISYLCQLVSSESQLDYSSSTLRVYSAIARFYPKQERAKWPVVLPFWIFRYAAHFEELSSTVLAWACEFLDQRGRTPFRREISQQFEPGASVVTTPVFSSDYFPYHLSEPSCPEAEQIEKTIPEHLAIEVATMNDEELNSIATDLANIAQRVRAKISYIPAYKREFAYQLLVIIKALIE